MGFQGAFVVELTTSPPPPNFWVSDVVKSPQLRSVLPKLYSCFGVSQKRKDIFLVILIALIRIEHRKLSIRNISFFINFHYITALLPTRVMDEDLL